MIILSYLPRYSNIIIVMKIKLNFKELIKVNVYPNRFER